MMGSSWLTSFGGLAAVRTRGRRHEDINSAVFCHAADDEGEKKGS